MKNTACSIYTDWHDEARENGKAIALDLSRQITKKVRNWKSEHLTQAEDFEDMEYTAEKAQDDIWEDLYQEEYIVSRAWDYCDGRFVYTSPDSLLEALHCINALSRYGSGNTALSEGKKDYRDVINIQATDAMDGATLHYAEKAVKLEICRRIVGDNGTAR